MTPDEIREKYRKRIAASLPAFERDEPVKAAEFRVQALRTLRLATPPTSRLGTMVFDARYAQLVAEYKGWPSEAEYSAQFATTETPA